MSSLYSSATILVGGNQAKNSPPLPVTSITDGSSQRLQVEAVPAGGVLPSQPAWGTQIGAQTIWQPVTNGGSSNLLVNGSASAPIVFSYTVGSKNILVTMLKLVMSASSINYTGNQITATTGLLGLGNSTRALPNGILINTVGAGITTSLAKIQINEDFLTFNGPANFVQGSSGCALTSQLVFTQPLVASTTDAVQVVIQDLMQNITTITYLRAYVGGVRAA